MKAITVKIRIIDEITDKTISVMKQIAYLVIIWSDFVFGRREGRGHHQYGSRAGGARDSRQCVGG